MANFVDRKIVLTAKPVLTIEGQEHLANLYENAGANRHDLDRNVSESSPCAAVIATAAGRGCYRSWDVPNEATNSTEEYLKNILRQKHHCYSSDTEVLTSEGWKRWEEVSMNDSFATLSASGQVEYQYPSEVIQEEYQGDMVRAKAKGVDLLVTPNHKMLACITTTRAGRRKENFSLIPADQLIGVSHAYKKDGDWRASGSGAGEDFAWLVGFFAGDGSIQGKWDNQIEFHMSKARKMSALSKAIQALGWKMSARYEKQREDTGHFSIFLPEDKVEFFRSFYDEDSQKRIPQEFIMSLNKEESLALLQGMIDSDGSVTNESGTGRVFDSTSKSLRDAFSQVALHAGFAANEVEGSTVIAGTEVEINGMKTTLARDCKRVSLSERNLRPEIGKKDSGASKTSYGWEKYSGTVYCATVPNHTLYVRRNGKPVWSGNSVLEHTSFTFHIENVSRAATHEIVRHRHFGFSQESQRFVLDKRGRDIVCPPLLRENKEAQVWLNNLADEAFDIRDSLVSKIKGERDDLKRKEIVEAARAVLPNAAATSLFVTGNARSWMEFIDKRDSPAADAEIREVAQEIHEQLAEAFPEIFGEEATKLWRGISNQEGVKNDK
ncbi:putative thymidylate synthase [Corynebacterium phage P1201]|uniref:Putative thymidylate synthase n=1 Tax=Corynebacterium phage P1201 TaxID=384848 RepID=A7IY93_9CAUD|nr:thymidylate synthase [Corynebacterium phage P1201]ABF57476.1 putative thymidylate synthase [Corynebacterium phage P1201]